MEALNAFEKIWGVGTEKALKLYSLGYKSIAQLRKSGKKELTTMQLIGLKYYDDLNLKNPRAEATEIWQVVNKAALNINSNL